MADMIVGSVGVRLVPAIDDFAEQTRAKLRNLSATLRLAVEVDEAAVQARLDELTRDRITTVTANADTAAATVRLDELARPRSATVNVDADTGGATAKIAALGGASSAASGGMSGLLVTATALAPALIPLTAAVGGLVAALSAPILAAGAGLTVFGVTAAVAAKQVEKTNQQIASLQKQADAATSPKTRQKYLDQIAQLRSGMSSAAVVFTQAQTNVSKAFKNLLASEGQNILGPVAKGMNLLAAILPKLKPLLEAVGGALDGLLGRLSKAVTGGSFDKTIKFLASITGPALRAGGQILGNLAQGFLSIVKATAPLGQALLDKFAKATNGFASIGQSRGFRDFLSYVQQVGPLVTSTLGAVAGAAAHIVRAFAPIGSFVLGVLRSIANAISAMPPRLITAVGVAFIGASVGIKLFAGAMALLEMNPVVLALIGLGAALVLVYEHSKKFRTAVSDAFGSLLKAGKQVGAWVKSDLLPVFDSVAKKVGDHLAPVVENLGGTFRKILPAIQDFIAWFAANMLPPIEAAATQIGKNLAPVIKTLRDVIVQDLFPALKTILPPLTRLFGGLLVVSSAFIGSVLPPLIKFVGYLIHKLAPIIGRFVDTALGFLKVWVDGAAKAFGWIPVDGIGKSLKSAAGSFDAFYGHVKGQIESLANLDPTITVKTKLDTSGLQALLGDFHGSKVPAKKRLKGQSSVGTDPLLTGIAKAQPAARTVTLSPPLASIVSRESSDSTGAGTHVGMLVQHMDVKAHDYNDFTKQMTRRRQRAALGGIG